MRRPVGGAPSEPHDLFSLLPELLVRIAEDAPFALAVMEGPQHRFTYANRLYRELSSDRGARMLGRPLVEVFPDVGKEAIALIDQIYATGQTVKLREFASKAIAHRPGLVWNITLMPLAAADGIVQAVVVILQDVTPLVAARGQAEERAREAEDSRQRLQGLMHCIPEGIAIADASGIIRTVSAFGCKMTGRRMEELEGTEPEEHPLRWGIRYPDGRTPPWHEVPLMRAIRTGAVIVDEEWILERPGGDRITVLCNAAPIQDRCGTIAGGVVAWRDITGLKRAEEARTATEESLLVALQAAGMATWDFDLAHDTPLGALRLEHIFGHDEPVRHWGPKEFLEHVVAEDQAAVAAQFEAAARGDAIAFQCRIQRADTGTLRWISMTGQPYKDKTGAPVRLAGVIQDVTATKQAEEEAERAALAIKENIQHRYQRLTPRQKAVMALVVAGHANKEVAYRLGIAERTVEGHRARVMARMCANDFASLVRMAATLGLDGNGHSTGAV